MLVDPPVNASVDVGNLRSQMQAVTSVQRDVRYRKCPRCHGVMNRRNFAAHSGVIIDECPTHGLFLDPGEFEAIETFVRLGGLALQRQSMQRRLREQTRRAEAAKAEASHSMWTVRRRYWWDVFFGI